MKIKKILAWFGIFVIGIIPVILLFAFGPKDYSSVTHTLGQISGLVGMTLFALSFLLSTRMKWIEDLFDGLDKVYPVHAVLGATSFVLLLLHPIFLVMKYIPANFGLAARYILPGGLLSVDFGIFALVGMIFLLVVTLYGKLKYERWKSSHEFLGIFFILAVLHVFLIRANVARDYIFEGYYVYAAIVSAIGVAGFVYGLLRTRLIGKEYKVKKLDIMNECFEITLSPVNEEIKFNAGQFVFVKFMNKNVGTESHPFSIALESGEGEIRIIAKNLGDFTSGLGNLRKGDSAIVEGPYGRFHEKEFKDEVWIAGGIGITPFLGLLKDFSNAKKGHVELFWSVKNKDEFICLDELQDVAKRNKNFRFTPWTSEEKGYLSIREIEKLGELKNKNYYMCGPVSLKVAMRNALIERGVSSSRIHDEGFAFK